jgi:cysteine desulfurase
MAGHSEREGKVVYLDHHATTPLDPRVLDAMMPYLTHEFGNASSATHAYGWRAREAVEKARAQVAQLIGAKPREIVFTSGATESINLALQGAVRARRNRTARIVTTPIEHRATLDCCDHLRAAGAEVASVAVDAEGFVKLDELERELAPGAIVVSIIHGNNEIGTLQDVEAIGRLAGAAGALLHVDAAQSLGKVPIDVRAMGIDLLSMSGHKIYGPKGVGALYVRSGTPGVKLEPILFGGGQERGLRPGTLNVPGIVGFGAACEIAAAEGAQETERLGSLRDLLWSLLQEKVAGVHLNGPRERRLPNNLNVSFERVEGEALLMALRDVAVSSGSACSSGRREASHVLRAIGVSTQLAHASLRFGLGRWTTREEIEFAAGRVAKEVARLRAIGFGDE